MSSAGYETGCDVMSLRDQLRGRSQPTEVIRLPLDPSAWTRVERELAALRWQLEEARSQGGRDTTALRARVEDAQARLDGLPCMEVTLRALPPPEWEALVELHPATEEQQTQGQRWNPTTFRPAVLAACVVTADGEDPMSADDWEQAAKLGEIGVGEYNALFSAAVNLNLRAPASAVGNGS
jgi:hypothetical protein